MSNPRKYVRLAPGSLAGTVSVVTIFLGNPISRLDKVAMGHPELKTENLTPLEGERAANMVERWIASQER